jgi:hypothetical protein
MSSHVDVGAWIVEIHRVLSKYNVDEQALDPLEAIITAGRLAEVFSATRSVGSIDALSLSKSSLLDTLPRVSFRSLYSSTRWPCALEDLGTWPGMPSDMRVRDKMVHYKITNRLVSRLRSYRLAPLLINNILSRATKRPRSEWRGTVLDPKAND